MTSNEIDEFFLKKAEQDYGAHWHHQDNFRQEYLEKNYLERRIAEAGWLVNNVKHPDDDDQHEIGDRREDHHGKSSSSSQFLWKKLFPSRKKDGRHTRGSNSNSNSNGVSSQSVSHSSGSSKKQKIEMMKQKKTIGPRRRKTIEEWEEEERLAQAEALRLKDEQIKRERYLIKKIQNIRIIERVIDWLSINRYPAHHKTLPHAKQHQKKIPEEIQEKNLRNYTIHPPQPVIEQLRDIDDVCEEMVAANRFRIPGRFHRHFGEGKIYPLQLYPETIKAILPPGSGKEDLPERKLLPDEDKRAAIHAKQEASEKEKRRQVVRIKKAKLDMSRVQVEFDRKTIERQEEENVLGREVNQQFHWHEHKMAEDNSVYRYPHPPVHFKEDGHTNDHSHDVDIEHDGTNCCDDSTLPSVVSYHLLDRPNLHRPIQLDSATLSPTTKAMAFNNDMNSLVLPPTYEAEASSSIAGITTPAQPLFRSSDDMGSDRAFRSNFLIENSITSRTQVSVRMQRHRKILHLDVHKLKHKPKLISLSRKNKLLQMKEEEMTS